MTLKLNEVCIAGTGSYFPERIMTNHDLESIVDTNDEWIQSRTGIKERRIAADNQATSDLGAEAALLAIKDANLTPEDIDLLICCTFSPDYPFPATACIIQDKIKAVNATAYDINAACSGFIYGMDAASQYIATGRFKNVLVIGAECNSRILNWKDRNTCVLFGDGAGAAVFSANLGKNRIFPTVSGSDGSYAKLLIQPGGGAVNPASHETVDKEYHYLQMEGSEVFKIAVKNFTAVAKQVCELNQIPVEDISYCVPHQANIRIISSFAKKLNFPMEKVVINLDRYGNTTAATIITALDELLRSGKAKKGDKILMVAFGAGFTWGATIMEV